jgi:hypothetical protein
MLDHLEHKPSATIGMIDSWDYQFQINRATENAWNAILMRLKNPRNPGESSV